MKGILKIACLAFCFTVAMTLFSCSNGSDGGGALLGVIGGGGTTTTPETDNGGGTTGGTNPTTPTPTPAVTYVITFNANDGSPNPATVPQNFTGGIPQALTPVEELGFSKTGFSFAGWGTAPKSKQASYADGASYTATANTTLYALWSESPVFSVNIPVNPNGNVTASPATAAAGMEITLSNTPNEGYQFASYSVTDADGGTVSVTNGKFTMPAKNVTVVAMFNAISYNVNMGTFADGSVTANPTTATVGTCVTLTATPASGYELATLVVTDSDGRSVKVDGVGNSRTFTMPSKNVTVAARFTAISFRIKIGTFEYGSVTSSPTLAKVGKIVYLTISPMVGYQLATLTVTASDGTFINVVGTDGRRTFTMPAQNVTVTASFVEIPAVSGEYKKIGTTTINGVECDLVAFGLWPQTIKSATVEIYESKTKKVGAYTYCRGSDGQWYAKIKENAYEKGYKYSNGLPVPSGSADSYSWFKVEPIKWRVLTTNYNGTGKMLLLAENILTNCRYYDYEYKSSSNRRDAYGYTVPANNYEYSKVRAFLNGISYQKKSYGGTQTACDDFLGEGFLHTAFTAAEMEKVADTSVDNSARSTNPDDNATAWFNGENPSASDTPTIDKVFLLSEQEATKAEYGFGAYDAVGVGNTRIRQTTDYAKASGVYQETTGDMGGLWWLRSPTWGNAGYAHYVNTEGKSGYSNNVIVETTGVVPALCVKN